MILTVNGSPRELDEASAVADLVEASLGDRAASGIAVAVNQTVVPHSAWAEHRLQPGDCVDLVTAVHGG